MGSENLLQQTVDEVIETLPGVWGRIRSNLRAAAIENFGITLEQFHVLRHIRSFFPQLFYFVLLSVESWKRLEDR